MRAVRAGRAGQALGTAGIRGALLSDEDLRTAQQAEAAEKKEEERQKKESRVKAQPRAGGRFARTVKTGEKKGQPRQRDVSLGAGEMPHGVIAKSRQQDTGAQLRQS